MSQTEKDFEWQPGGLTVGVILETPPLVVRVLCSNTAGDPFCNSVSECGRHFIHH